MERAGEAPNLSGVQQDEWAKGDGLVNDSPYLQAVQSDSLFGYFGGFYDSYALARMCYAYMKLSDIDAVLTGRYDGPKIVENGFLWHGSPWPYQYSHWFSDFVYPLIMLRQQIIDCKMPIRFGFRLNSFQREWLQILDIRYWADSRCSGLYQSKGDVLVMRVPTHLTLPKGDRAFLLRKLPHRNTRPASQCFFYLVRGVTMRSGGIYREVEFADYLASHFRVQALDPRALSQHEMSEHLSGAQLLISVHGAQLANLVFCPEGCKVVEIYWPDPHDEVGTKNEFRDRCITWGLEYFRYESASVKYIKDSYHEMGVSFEDFASYLTDTVLS